MTSEQLSADKVGQVDSKPLILLGDRYKVLSVLGDGGFGQTFLVEDTHMPSNRRCVLKQLKPVHEKPELRQVVEDRFQREAATLEMLGDAHDQIPRLYAYFSEGGQFYLVEEWVAGMTLSQKVYQEGALSEAQVQAILSNLLPAIAYVHSKKIVHRDIKPDNIILRQTDGKPVLIDFGAVKETMKTIINSGEQSKNSIVVGTPGYMPTEQLSGRPVYASDIYSLGMTAIFLLTGKIPQELGTNPQTGSLSWREHAAGISSGFANFLDCATHMSPQSRFSSVQDMQHALNTLMMSQMSTVVGTQLPPQPTPPTPAQNNNIAPAASVENTPPTAPQSAQTVVSSSPVAAAEAYTAGTHETETNTANQNTAHQTTAHNKLETESTSLHTAMVAPLGDASEGNASEPSVIYAQSGSSNAAWRGPAIIGGLIGLSIVAGALVVTERLPGIVTSSDTTEVVEPIEREGDDVDAETDDTDSGAEQTKTPNPTPTPTPIATAPPASAPNANGTVVGQSGRKNIRAGAGTNFNVVDEVSVRDRIQVINRANDAEGFPWYQVVTPSGSRGWIAGQLIQIDGDARPVSPRPTPTPTPTPTPPADPTNATIVSNESGSKNIRSGPGTNFGVAHEAYPGDRIVIRDTAKDAGGYTWYKVYFPKSGAEGWIAAQLVNRD